MGCEEAHECPMLAPPYVRESATFGKFGNMSRHYFGTHVHIGYNKNHPSSLYHSGPLLSSTPGLLHIPSFLHFIVGLFISLPYQGFLLQNPR